MQSHSFVREVLFSVFCFVFERGPSSVNQADLELEVVFCWELVLILCLNLALKAASLGLSDPAPSRPPLVIKNCCTDSGWAGRRGGAFRLCGQGMEREGKRKRIILTQGRGIRFKSCGRKLSSNIGENGMPPAGGGGGVLPNR